MTGTHLARAALEPELPLQTFAAGRAWAPAGFVLDDALVEAYLDATGEHHPLYRAQGYAPPLMATLVRWVKASLGGRWPSGTLQLDHRLSLHRALRRGEALSIDARVLRDEWRGERFCWDLGSTLRDAAGDILGEQASLSMGAGAAPRAAQTAQTLQAVQARGAPDAPDAPELGPLQARFDARALVAFGQVAGALDPIHVDPDYARGTRWGVTIVQGRLVMSLVSRLMLERFGERWLRAPALSVRFERAVRVDEPLCATGVCIDPRSLRYAIRVLDGSGQAVVTGWAQPGEAGEQAVTRMRTDEEGGSTT